MIEADLLVEGIGELVTCRGPAPRTGRAMRDSGVVPDAFLACRGGRVVAAGPAREAAAVRLTPGGARLPASGGTVLPGFVDPHTHLAFAGTREDEFNRILQGETYQQISASGGGIAKTVAATRAASFEELKEISRRYLDGMLAHGTTTAEAKSGYGLETATEIRQLEVIRALSREHPVRLVPTFLGAHTVPPEYRDHRDRYVELVTREMIPRVAAEHLAEFCDVFCEAGAFTADESRRVLECGKRYGLKPKIHAEEFSDLGGAALAADLGAASADHLGHVSRKSTEAMARAGTAAVLLPATTFFLRKREYAPARDIIEAGVTLALGTDFNPGSSMTISMQAVLWLACLKLGMTIDEAIVAATLNAAHATGVSDSVGSLEPGKAADFAVYGVPGRHHLVYRWGTNHAVVVVKQGKIAHDARPRQPRSDGGWMPG